MARIRGRRLYPSTLAERRVLLGLGCNALYVARGKNPFLVARKLARVAKAESGDLEQLRGLADRAHRPKPPAPHPVDADHNEPTGNHPVHVEPPSATA